ncbi:hypothetical protein BS50DRAFT_309187 [Corynespora cassiicola Philippines]|uniref:Uncharacterized protein n=1 Tax=Corynespora cassiicola Philippines TaxID=1448308 RepID=A0A2T2NXZ7_CORCC|nr:hypothetical protein BS50DRAFT_309187 [Corynespora cassiicola Philippines]
MAAKPKILHRSRPLSGPGVLFSRPSQSDDELAPSSFANGRQTSSTNTPPATAGQAPATLCMAVGARGRRLLRVFHLALLAERVGTPTNVRHLTPAPSKQQASTQLRLLVALGDGAPRVLPGWLLAHTHHTHALPVRSHEPRAARSFGGTTYLPGPPFPSPMVTHRAKTQVLCPV